MREQKVVGVGSSRGVILPTYERSLIKAWDGKRVLVEFHCNHGKYKWTVTPIIRKVEKI